MRVYATADLHGDLPDGWWDRMESGDLFIIAGDVCPDFLGKVEKYTIADKGAGFQLNWLDTTFRAWLDEFSERGICVVGIAGNHDFVFEEFDRDVIDGLLLPWKYLCDEEFTYEGGDIDLKMYGTPWVPGLARWAFYMDDAALAARADAIPADLDILISHGPPRGTADHTSEIYGSMDVGDKHLVAALAEKKPGVVICGHIHEGFGVWETEDGTRLYNVSHNDEVYGPDKRPALTIWEFSDITVSNNPSNNPNPDDHVWAVE